MPTTSSRWASTRPPSPRSRRTLSRCSASCRTRPQRFKAEYETLHRAPKKSTSRRSGCSRSAASSSDIATSTKVATAVRLSARTRTSSRSSKRTSRRSGAASSSRTRRRRRRTRWRCCTPISSSSASPSTRAPARRSPSRTAARARCRARRAAARARPARAAAAGARRDRRDPERLKVLEAEKVVADQAVADITQQIDQKRAETEREKAHERPRAQGAQGAAREAAGCDHDKQARRRGSRTRASSSSSCASRSITPTRRSEVDGPAWRASCRSSSRTRWRPTPTW